VSDPVRSGTGYHVLQLVESEPSRVADFDEIEALVRAEWTRRTGERALREYLDDLRARAEIVQ
jgi:peptidylprolyl isomerase